MTSTNSIYNSYLAYCQSLGISLDSFDSSFETWYTNSEKLFQGKELVRLQRDNFEPPLPEHHGFSPSDARFRYGIKWTDQK